MGRGGEELQKKCGEVRLRPADAAGIAEATRVAYAEDFHGLVGITWPSSCRRRAMRQSERPAD